MNNLKYIILVLIYIGLYGCATIPDTNIQKVKGSLKVNEGIVIAEVINNSKIITSRLTDWNELVLWKMDEPDKTKATFSITALKNPSSSFLFAGRLTAGKYRVGLLYSFLTLGDASYSARAFIPPAIGEFDVVAGQVTDLGTLLYHSFQIRSLFQLEMPDYAITRVDNPALIPSIKRTSPNVFDAIELNNINGWNEDDNSEIRNKDYSLMKSSGFTSHIFPIKKSEFVITGKLGAFYYFKNNTVEKINIPTDREISAFAMTQSGDWIIGGEYGLLMKSSFPFKEWKTISLSDSFNHIIDIDSNNKGMTFVLSFDGNKYNVHEYQNDTFKMHKSFLNKESFWFENGLKPRMKLYDDRIEVSIDKVQYNLFFNDPTQWKESSITEYLKIDHQANGLQLTAKSSTWSGSGPLLVSKNAGKSWEKVSNSDVTPTFNRPYLFNDGGILLVQRMDKIKLFRSIKEYQKVKVKLSKDKGTTFNQIGELPKGCYTIAHNISNDEHLYVWCDNGEIFTSTDRGDNWSGVHVGYQNLFDEFSKQLKVEFSKYRE